MKINKCRLGIHNWGKWEQYQQDFVLYPREGFWGPFSKTGYNISELWQKRLCVRCNKLERERVYL